MEELDVAREALETLAVCLTLYPAGLEALQKDNAWQIFILDMVLICKTRLAIFLETYALICATRSMHAS